MAQKCQICVENEEPDSVVYLIISGTELVMFEYQEDIIPPTCKIGILRLQTTTNNLL